MGGVVLGFVGAILQVTAISRVVGDMGNAAKIGAYAVGVALGVLLGCVIDRRVAADRWSVRRVRTRATASRPTLRVSGAGRSPRRTVTATTDRSSSSTSRSTSAGRRSSRRAPRAGAGASWTSRVSRRAAAARVTSM